MVEALIGSAKSSVQQTNDPKNTTVVQDLIRSLDVNLETALHVAVRYNHKDLVELLVKEDPSHSYPQNKQNETPLYMASMRYNFDIVKIILENCESPTFGGPHGRTALHAAVMSTVGAGVFFKLDATKCDTTGPAGMCIKFTCNKCILTCLLMRTGVLPSTFVLQCIQLSLLVCCSVF